MATQIGRNVLRRISAISKPPFPGRCAFIARAQHQVAADGPSVVSVSKADTIVSNLIVASLGGVFFYWTYYKAYKSINPSGIRKTAEKKAMEKLKRKLNTVEAKLRESGGDGEKLMMYEREFAGLKEFVSASYYTPTNEGRIIHCRGMDKEA